MLQSFVRGSDRGSRYAQESPRLSSRSAWPACDPLELSAADRAVAFALCLCGGERGACGKTSAGAEDADLGQPRLSDAACAERACRNIGEAQRHLDCLPFRTLLAGG